MKKEEMDFIQLVIMVQQNVIEFFFLSGYNELIHAVDFMGENGFYMACLNDHVETVTVLTKYGFNVMKLNRCGQLGFHVASESNALEIWKYLLKNNFINVNMFSKQQCVDFLVSILREEYNRVELFELLHEYNFVKKIMFQEIFHEFCGDEGELEVIQILIKHGFDLKLETRSGDYDRKFGVDIAFKYKHFNIALFLLE